MFSVIFHKPFLVLGNVKRGQGRFLSLFNILNLPGKILTEVNKYCNQYLNRFDNDTRLKAEDYLKRFNLMLLPTPLHIVNDYVEDFEMHGNN